MNNELVKHLYEFAEKISGEINIDIKNHYFDHEDLIQQIVLNGMMFFKRDSKINWKILKYRFWAFLRDNNIRWCGRREIL